MDIYWVSLIGKKMNILMLKELFHDYDTEVRNKSAGKVVHRGSCEVLDTSAKEEPSEVVEVHSDGQSFYSFISGIEEKLSKAVDSGIQDIEV